VSKKRIFRTGSNTRGQLVHTRLKICTHELLEHKLLGDITQIACATSFVMFLKGIS
jgi:hypothetical protein